MSPDTNSQRHARKTDSDAHETTSSTGEARSETDSTGDLPYRSRPTLRPTLIWLGLVLLLGLGSIAYVTVDPGAFGGQESAGLVVRALALLTGIGVVRFLVRLYVLRRTEYVVDERAIRRQYELLFRTWEREVPLSMVRSYGARQSRIQKLLGYGTVSANRGLGAIELENIPDVHRIHDLIGTLLERQQ